MFRSLEEENKRSWPEDLNKLDGHWGLVCKCCERTFTGQKHRKKCRDCDGAWDGLPDPQTHSLLPPVGARVKIELARPLCLVEVKVTGYTVWADLGGDPHLNRVFVNVLDNEGYPNSRLLKDIHPIIITKASKS